ncbi:MAG: G5 domain-containing protein [Armatimonadota bacterium]|nr:G5 domain-containing protein [Armatimonadota bacterium]MCX7778466.1 G5 domain-containing protein [Armatimonadota bacterium]MDW8026045.1 G5 domain-containing protein [Armatimonadota bacterium]
MHRIERLVYWAVIAMLLVVIAVQWRSRQPYAVIVKGNVIGWVGSKSIYQHALNMALNEARRLHRDMPVSFIEVEGGEVLCERQMPRGKVELLMPRELASLLLRHLTLSYKAGAILVDGKPILALKDEQSARNVIEGLKAHFAKFASYAGELIKEASFKEKVEVKVAGIPVEIYAHSEDEALKRLLEGGEKPLYHKVQRGEVAIAIARKYGISLAELQRLNGGRDLNKLKIGELLLIKPGKPLLTVVTFHQQRLQERLPFKEERKLVPHLPGGEVIIKRKGQEGLKEVIYEVKCENGVEVSREVISERIIKEPVDQLVVVGGGLHGRHQ